MNHKIAVVLGSFHQDQMLQMQKTCHKVAQERSLTITREIWVPGSMEKPLIVKKLLQDPDIDGVVVLGIIERGETKHGYVMGDAVIKAFIQLQLEYEKPMGVGIIGPEVFPTQIEPRLEGATENAVNAVYEMLNLLAE